MSGINKNRKSVFREVGLDMDMDMERSDIMAPPAADPAFASEHEAEHSTRLMPLDTRSAERHFAAEAGYEKGEASRDIRNVARDTQARCHEQHEVSPLSETSSSGSPTSKSPWYTKLATGKRPQVRTGSNAPPSAFKPLSTVTMLALAIVVMAPLAGRMNRETMGVADAGVVLHRADSPTDVCARWAQQSVYKHG